MKYKSCTGKVRHGSYKQALDHARRLGLCCYKCRFCKGWHVGHAPWWLKKKLREKAARAHGHRE